MAEVAATAEHAVSLTVAAGALQLEPDVPEQPAAGQAATVSIPSPASAPPAAVPMLEEIRAWSAASLGIDRTPDVWLGLAHHPRLLEAVWHKHRLVLGDGALSEMVKVCAALAVAQSRQSRYWVAYLSHLLRQSFGLDDRALVEAMGMTMHAAAFNTIAHGMGLEAPFQDLSAEDFAPGGRLEHARRPVGPPDGAAKEP